MKFYQHVGLTLLEYEEPAQAWQLVNEESKISNLTCKKATINYKGRNWTAWYSTEINLPYGPYKFGGLPGLIVKISDDTGDFDFEIVSSVSSQNWLVLRYS